MVQRRPRLTAAQKAAVVLDPATAWQERTHGGIATRARTELNPVERVVSQRSAGQLCWRNLAQPVG